MYTRLKSFQPLKLSELFQRQRALNLWNNFR